MKAKIVASELLLKAVHRHEIHLSLLVADTGLWANPDFHSRLVADTGSAAMFPMVRRARIGQGEKRGDIIDGVRFDDNTYANVAIKRAVGLGKSAEGFEACHIWPLTCYDERYHTAVANIILLPRALAGLSDHDDEIQKVLQYRALELYDWWPQELSRPVKPDFYPADWRDPQPDILIRSTRSRSAGTGSDKISQEQHRTLSDRITYWSGRPDLNVHKIIALVASYRGGVSRDELVRRVEEVTGSKSPYGAVASLLTDSGNAYGRVFSNHAGIITIHQDVEDHLRSLTWRPTSAST